MPCPNHRHCGECRGRAPVTELRPHALGGEERANPFDTLPPLSPWEVSTPPPANQSSVAGGLNAGFLTPTGCTIARVRSGFDPTRMSLLRESPSDVGGQQGACMFRLFGVTPHLSRYPAHNCLSVSRLAYAHCLQGRQVSRPSPRDRCTLKRTKGILLVCIKKKTEAKSFNPDQATNIHITR